MGPGYDGLDGSAGPGLRVGIFGGALDTGNLGVSALGIGSALGVLEARPDTHVTLFDYGKGVRERVLHVNGRPHRVELCGASYSRRYYRASNEQVASLFSRFGLGRLHPLARRIRGMDAVLDVSGGDSFSDLYGEWVFRSVAAPKRLVLESKRPLFLLPQTYGPFRDPTLLSDARILLSAAAMLWARDARSLGVAASILGSDFDERRHRMGVDVAFGLPALERKASERRARETREGNPRSPVFGLNVSGLIYHGSSENDRRFGLALNYRDLVLEIALRLLDVDGSQLLLVPHVVAPCAPKEDDHRACLDLLERLPETLRSRVEVVSPTSDPTEIKGVIGGCDWFCGTRMHACIAGLSQAVPTVNIAYSDKSIGVFETAGEGAAVFDPRKLSAKSVLDGIMATVRGRASTRVRLEGVQEGLKSRWRSQFEDLMRSVESVNRVTSTEESS